MKELSRNEYIDEIQYCYKNSRWEFSFYAVLYSFLCQFRSEQIKLVHCANWTSHGKNTSQLMREVLKYCSIKFTDKNGEECIGGIPDFQFVPSQYTYETPCKAKVFIEFKSPNFSDESDYNPLKYEKTSEIEHEFGSCDKIIFTDGVSWYFLKKHKVEPEAHINLYSDNKNWEQLKNQITKFISDEID